MSKEDQQSFKYNILSATSRKFYIKKKPSHEVFHVQPRISKIMKTLRVHPTKTQNKIQPIRTEGNQFRMSQEMTFNEFDFVKKQLKIRIEALLKKASSKWKLFYEAYEDMKQCSNRQALLSQQNKFYRMLLDLLKKNTQVQVNKMNFQKSFRKSIETQKQERYSLLNIENLKLTKQNQILRKRLLQPTKKKQNPFLNIQNLQSNSKFIDQNESKNTKPTNQGTKGERTEYQAELNQKLKHQINQLNQTIFQFQNENLKFKQNLVIAEDSLNLIKADRQQLAKKVGELKGQNQNLCAQIIKMNLQNQDFEAKVERWRAVMKFQKQEIISYDLQLNSIKNQYKDLMRKYKILLKRLNNISNCKSPTSSSLNTNILNDHINSKYYELFKEQLDTFAKIRSIFANKQSEANIQKTTSRTERRPTIIAAENMYKNYLPEKQTLSNINGVKKFQREYYSYLKPNFFNLIEGYMDLHGIDSSTFQQFTGGFDLTCQFLTTIRGILDSKFNEFLKEDFRNISSMSSFVYAWLTKYKINKKQKKIISVNGDGDSDTIPTFFINLMSEKLNNNWEIIAFRQFLMQTLTIDQLYFYLMARHYLLRGNLLSNISVVYQEIYYIHIGEALNLLQKFIPDINYRKKIQEYLKRFMVYVRKRALIDAHFILRILLEFYQSKKHQQFASLHALTELLARQKSSSLSFQNYLKIFQYNFTYVSLTEKLDIYKKCFSCGKGKISLQIILTVLTEEGYLCREVKSFFLNDPLTLVKQDQKPEVTEGLSQKNLTEVIDFQDFYQRFLKSVFQQEKTSLGLQQLQNRFSLINDFDQGNIFIRMEEVFKLCLLSLKKLFYSKKLPLSSFLPVLKQVTSMLQRLDNITCQKKRIMQILWEFKRNSAAKTILRFYRKKRNQMHRNFILGIKDQILQEDQKILNLRKQFSSMIENLKEKFQAQ